MTISAAQLIGGWTLKSWRIEYSDGRITHPFGENAQGQIIYSSDGEMSATVMAEQRPSMGAQNVRTASEAEQAHGFRSYFHYAGHWRLEGDVVSHQVTLALNPNFIGTEQRRNAKLLNQDNLTLSADEPLAAGGSRKHVLEWQKR